MKFFAKEYLSALFAGTTFRSTLSWALGPSWKMSTVAHVYVYNNKLTVKKQEVLQIFQVWYISIQFMPSHLPTNIGLSFPGVIWKSILALLNYSIFCGKFFHDILVASRKDQVSPSVRWFKTKEILIKINRLIPWGTIPKASTSIMYKHIHDHNQGCQ